MTLNGRHYYLWNCAIIHFFVDDIILYNKKLEKIISDHICLVIDIVDMIVLFKWSKNNRSYRVSIRSYCFYCASNYFETHHLLHFKSLFNLRYIYILTHLIINTCVTTLCTSNVSFKLYDDHNEIFDNVEPD